MEKFRYPLDFLGINLDYGATSNPYSVNNPHKGIDFGWVDYQGEPVYSIGSGTVVESTFNNECGNYCAIKHDNGYVSYYFHLKALPIVKVGQIIYREQLIGYMGNTGYSFGTHLHLGIKLNGAWIDPKSVCYLYPNQNANTPTKNMGINIYKEEPTTKYVGTPIQKDNTKDQIVVINNVLNCRDNPNGNILGYANLGTYNILDSKVVGNYTWYEIERNKWIAYNEEWEILEMNYTKTLETQKALQDKQIEELNNKIDKLNNENTKLTDENSKLNKELENADKYNEYNRLFKISNIEIYYKRV